MANTTTFRRLPDLPPEIRIMIFKYALPAPGPKIAVWTTMFPESKHPEFVSRWEIMNSAAWDIIPALLMTNSEAREVALQHLELVYSAITRKSTIDAQKYTHGPIPRLLNGEKDLNLWLCLELNLNCLSWCHEEDRLHLKLCPKENRQYRECLLKLGEKHLGPELCPEAIRDANWKNRAEYEGSRWVNKTNLDYLVRQVWEGYRYATKWKVGTTLLFGDKLLDWYIQIYVM
jgi:hypothetical protein